MKAIKVTISAATLRAVMPAAGVSDIRYYLNGLAIRPHAQGGVLAIATDGHVLAIAHDPKGAWESESDEPLILARQGRKWEGGLLADVARLKPGLDERLSFICEDDGTACSIEWEATGLKSSLPKGRIDGKYPDVSVFANPKSSGLPAGFDPNNLEAAFACVAGASLALGKRQAGFAPSVVMYTNGEGTSLVLGTDAPVAVFVMPRRTSRHDSKDQAPREEFPVEGLEWLNTAFPAKENADAEALAA